MRKLALVILSAVLLAACNQNTSNKNNASANAASVASIDSLNIALYNAWNKKDSAAVLSMFSNDVIMISGRAIYKGKEEVARNFVLRQMPHTSNLNGKSERSDASGDLGYLAGTWSLTLTPPDQAPMGSSGNYTFLFKRGEDGIWKFSVLTIENHDPIK